jgi:hypothetical protein
MHADPRNCVSLSFRPRRLRSSVRIKWRIDVDEIDTAGGELADLIKIVAAVDDPGIDERGGALSPFSSIVPKVRRVVNGRQCSP